MRLSLFSSVAGRAVPNLVSIQHPGLVALPTILVCPIKSGEPITNVRASLKWQETTVQMEA